MTTGAPPSARDGVRKLLRTRLRSLSARGDLAQLAAAQFAPMPTYFVLNIVTAATLDPSERGTATLVVGSGAVGATLLFGSMHVGAVLAVREKDSTALRRVTLAIIGVALACGVGGVAAFAGDPPGIGLYTGPVVGQILVGLALTVPLLFATRTIQGLGHARLYRQLTLLHAGLYFVGAIFCLVVLGRRSPLSVTIPWLTASAAVMVVGSVTLRRLVRRVDWPSQGGNVTAVAASLAAHSGSVTQQLAYRIDLFLLGWFVSAAAIGLYTLSTAIAEVVWVVPEVLALYVFADPRVRAALGWREIVSRRVRQAVYCSAVAVVVVFGGGAILLLYILPEYRGSLVFLALLLPGVLAGAAARVILAVLTARDERHLLRLAAVGNLAIACLYLPAIALGGVTGAAVASTFVYCLQLLIAQRLWKRARACTT
jgi:hypothetical protein